jgi:hypothetical protein
MQSIHHDRATREKDLVLDLDEIAHRGAKKMLAQGLEAKIQVA